MQVLERAPATPPGGAHVLFEQFWLEKGPMSLPELPSADGEFVSLAYVLCGWQKVYMFPLHSPAGYLTLVLNNCFSITALDAVAYPCYQLCITMQHTSAAFINIGISIGSWYSRLVLTGQLCIFKPNMLIPLIFGGKQPVSWLV